MKTKQKWLILLELIRCDNFFLSRFFLTLLFYKLLLLVVSLRLRPTIIKNKEEEKSKLTIATLVGNKPWG